MVLFILLTVGCTKEAYQEDIPTIGFPSTCQDCYNGEDLLDFLTWFDNDLSLQLAWVPVYHNHTEIISNFNGPNNISKINGVSWPNLSPEEQADYEWEWSRDAVVLSTLADPSFNDLLTNGPLPCVGVFELTLKCTRLSDDLLMERTEWVSYTYDWLAGEYGVCQGAPNEVEINYPFYPGEAWDLDGDNEISTQDLLLFLANYC